MSEKIIIQNDKLCIPDNPIIPYIEGDGIGVDIWPATKKVLDAAIQKAYNGSKQIDWLEILAGEKAFKKTNEWLPEDTLNAILTYRIAIKGPLTTPVGGGIRSLNVTLRQKLDLFSCVRPVKYIPGVPSPVKAPENIDMIIFRENTEDVYAGIEWEADSLEGTQVTDFLRNTMGKNIPDNCGIGIKPISKTASRKIVKSAIDYAILQKKTSVTLVHKGNIMKYTEGAFKNWGYELAAEQYSDLVISWDEVALKHQGIVPKGKIMIKDVIADAMFQQILLRPKEYSVIATMNLNGDYLSDALAAQVGGLGLAPGANIGDNIAIFEATHGTAPKYAGQDKVNPGSLILSGKMMLDYLGWDQASKLIEKALEKTIKNKTVTYDLHRQIEGATLLKCSDFANQIISNM